MSCSYWCLFLFVCFSHNVILVYFYICVFSLDSSRIRYQLMSSFYCLQENLQAFNNSWMWISVLHPLEKPLFVWRCSPKDDGRPIRKWSRSESLCSSIPTMAAWRDETWFFDKPTGGGCDRWIVQKNKQRTSSSMNQ